MNIVYIVFAPLSINYAKFLNIQNFRKNGFNVHICDISSFFYSKKQSVSYFKSTKEFYKPHLENITNVSSPMNYKNICKFLRIQINLLYR